MSAAGKLKRYRTLLAGLLSPFAAAAIGMGVYLVTTRASENRDTDFAFRLSLTAIGMAVPFILTLLLALADRRGSAFGAPSRIGLVVAVLSLGMTWVPIRGLVVRSQQAASLARENVPAPEMVTTDIDGNSFRLSDYGGKVVLLNIWATWCPPCRKEMPELDRLYKDRAADGLVVLGLSTEDVALQREFARKINVSYPLLTGEGQVPDMFRNIARYPSNFLIDRSGNLRRAPGTDEPFDNLVRVVGGLLGEPVP